jgi:predicted NBD/HSP70 family sugar kinase
MIAVFDCGGTEIKYGIMNFDGDFVLKRTQPSKASMGGKEMVDALIPIILKYKDRYNISGVAISATGVVHPNSGVVLASNQTIKDYDGFKIKNYIELQTGLFTTVENDVNCAALAEANFGYELLNNFIVLTVGTGIGGAIVLNKNVYHGHSYSSGEWGHMIINGQRYEDIASTSSLVRNVQSSGLNVESGIEVFYHYDRKEPLAVKCVNHFYDALATGIANLIFILNPAYVVIGGGISNRKLFLDELNHHLSSKLPPYYKKNVTLRTATFLNDASMIGAYVHHMSLKK